MKINAITLTNFRQYRDFKIEFDNSNPEKNVTVFRAKNSTGKTTLAQSILWCFYGDEEVELDLSEHLINKFEQKDAEDFGKEDVSFSVEVEILDQNTTNFLKRTQTRFTSSRRKKQEKVEFSYMENGERIIKTAYDAESENMKMINRKINSMLSRDIAKNFIFDGERIEKIADSSKKKNRDRISESISSMSSMPTLQNALNTLDSLSRRLRREEAESISEDLAKVEYDLTSKEKEMTKHNYDLSNKLERQNKIKEESKYIENTLLSYDDISVLQQNKLNLDKRSDELIKNLESLTKTIYSKYTDYLMRRETYKLFKKYETLDITASEFSNSIPHMTTHTIDFIIDRGVCVCGSEIDNEELSNLENQKRYQPPISPESLVKTYETDVLRQMGNINDSVDDLEKYINEYNDASDKLLDLHEDIKELEERIDSTQIKDIQDLRQRLKELNKESGSLANDIQSLRTNIDLLNESITQLKIEFSEAERQKKIHEKIAAKNLIVQGAIETLQNISQSRKSEIRAEIEKRANEHFSEIISKEKSIVLGEDFEHKVLDGFNELSSISSGESIAVSMSIILAIIETHKNRILTHHSLESHILTDKDFFLVMDGPFAVLDQDFSSTIAFKLANTVEQIILLTNDNQYNESVRNTLAPQVSKEFILDAPTGQQENLKTEYLQEVEN